MMRRTSLRSLGILFLLMILCVPINAVNAAGGTADSSILPESNLLAGGGNGTGREDSSSAKNQKPQGILAAATATDQGIIPVITVTPQVDGSVVHIMGNRDRVWGEDR
jgi:hypothetical protein